MGERLEKLKEKVRKLPLEPGVYLMKNRDGQVIYVGKAKALKNRVSQYFQNDARHSPKTRKMVSLIDDFEIIITESEFEALILENAMIKKYKPKYNILLKDDKGYPFLRVTLSRPYPAFQVVSAPGKDGERYFGPYMGRRAARQTVDSICETLKLATCRRVFPRDIGKERPCLNYHLGRCVAPCTGKVTSEEYHELIGQAVSLLEGNYRKLVHDIEAKMQEAADNLQFERAAALRDRLRAINGIGEKQKVVAGSQAETDVVAFYQGQTRACVVVLHYLEGSLHDKEYTMIEGVSAEDAGEVLSAFIKQYYALRSSAPRTLLLSHLIEDEETVAGYLERLAEHKVEIAVPQRGKRHDLIRLAQKNAAEEIARAESAQERHAKSLELLQNMTGLPNLPRLLESYDISNFAGGDTVGSMVVFENGQPKKSRYRRFQIACAAKGQDDYASMAEMLTRRLARYRAGDEKFAPLPDVFLIDGGLGHVHTAERVLRQFGFAVPIFGMVKDDRHRTRGLVTPDGREFGISTIPAVFTLIGRIQEETHRFAIEYNRKLSGKRVRGSALDKIEGVGEKRRNDLLRHFGGLENIRRAELAELCNVVPAGVAQAVYAYFNGEKNREGNS